ncbi:RING/Ubox like zinc-binding domain-containing protein [Gorgonomyces haynaldii]|nr:RING/Ubox like zinc-binding domain-containing protein [Gorgonomyces haynaldii]
MNSSDSEEDLECPLCMEEIDITDKYFKPCPCGYQVCRFCWNHIKENLNGLCPACRRPYSDENIEFKAVSPEELSRIKNAKKKKEREKREQDLAARRQLANVRVVQKNLVYVLGLPLKLATEETLRSHDYFGQYGKINKIVVNRKAPIAQGQPPNTGVYITFARKEDATRAIENVDGSVCEGRVIRATFGTTKYCSYYLKNQPCQNVGCQFLHETGEEADTFGKDELMYPKMGNHRERQMKPNIFPSKATDKEENVLPATASWARSGSNKQFPSLSQMNSQSESNYDSEGDHAQVSNDHYPPLEENRDRNDSIPDTRSTTTSENNLLPKSVEKSDYRRHNVSYGSVSVGQHTDQMNDVMDLLPLDVGYVLVLKYNGLFNPFSDDIMDLGSTKDLGDRKSRFERLFDDRYRTISEEKVHHLISDALPKHSTTEQVC